MENLSPTFIITREDQVVDPVTLSTQALRVGRQIDCEILLNHPTVSRLHAGINEVDGRFYLIRLSSSHPVTLNGRLVELNEPEALADGDVAQIGSFLLHMSRTGGALNIHVLVQVAVNVSEAVEQALEHPLTPESALAPPNVADALKEFWDKRTRDKAARPSPLHPRRTPRPGKAQFAWKPTRDLIRPWRFSVFIWGAIFITAISVMAAFWYASAFSPGAISRPHAQTSLVRSTPTSAIAKQPNAGSCMTCHAIGVSLEANCVSCHQTEAFAANVSGIPAHAEAGIGCITCHTEHEGMDFRPANTAVNMCANCHRDENKELYRGRRVGTPHAGTIGYPVVDGKWKWEGPREEAWNQRADAAAVRMKTARERIPGETDDQWRNRQFHALHLHRILVRDVGLEGDENGEMSCSTCHKSFEPIDRTSPQTTCVRCHIGQADNREAPNCASCHTQHGRGSWDSKRFAPAAVESF